MTENIFFSLIMKYLLVQTDRWKEVKLKSKKCIFSLWRNEMFSKERKVRNFCVVPDRTLI